MLSNDDVWRISISEGYFQVTRNNIVESIVNMDNPIKLELEKHYFREKIKSLSALYPTIVEGEEHLL